MYSSILTVYVTNRSCSIFIEFVQIKFDPSCNSKFENKIIDNLNEIIKNECFNFLGTKIYLIDNGLMFNFVCRAKGINYII